MPSPPDFHSHTTSRSTVGDAAEVRLPVLAPLWMPTPIRVSEIHQIDRSGGSTVRTVRALIDDADIAVCDLPPAAGRMVVLRLDDSLAPGEVGPLHCEEGAAGTVAITVSQSLSSVDAARQALAVLAYSIFDAEARAAVRGQPWTLLSVDHH